MTQIPLNAKIYGEMSPRLITAPAVPVIFKKLAPPLAAPVFLQWLSNLLSLPVTIQVPQVQKACHSQATPAP